MKAFVYNDNQMESTTTPCEQPMSPMSLETPSPTKRHTFAQMETVLKQRTSIDKSCSSTDRPPVHNRNSLTGRATIIKGVQTTTPLIERKVNSECDMQWNTSIDRDISILDSVYVQKKPTVVTTIPQKNTWQQLLQQDISSFVHLDDTNLLTEDERGEIVLRCLIVFHRSHSFVPRHMTLPLIWKTFNRYYGMYTKKIRNDFIDVSIILQRILQYTDATQNN